jgi:GNAT superfamily N-acetyltransferase
MSEQLLLELLGYAASILVAISLMMSSILRLRVINLIGALAFALYGWLIGSIPVAAVNLFIVVINVYYLQGMLRSREYFRLLELSPDSEYLRYFLSFHSAQIHRFNPETSAAGAAEVNLLVLRDVVPAGLLIGDIEGSTLRVKIDFVIPQYRDFKVGRFLFSESASFFRERGIREIVTGGGSREHSRYLERMGFRRVKGADGVPEYHLAISAGSGHDGSVASAGSTL